MTTDFTLIQQTMAAFGPHYSEASRQALTDAGFEGFDWLATFVASGLQPELYTPEYHHLLGPYRNIQDQKQMLKDTASRGFIEALDDNTYKITETGQRGIDNFFTSTGRAINHVKGLPEEQIIRLADLLDRVIEATITAEMPTEKRWLMLSRHTDRNPDAAPNIRIDQYLTDLLRYRDDAHFAAWTPHNIEGQAWEAFSLIWQKEYNSAATLAERLNRNRGYDETAYANALADLVERGWIVKTDGSYTITAQGSKLREEVEALTDTYFYQGWSALSEAEIAEMNSLLEQLRDTLITITADDAVSTYSECWPLATSISQSLFSLTHQSVDPLVEKLGLNKRGLTFILIQAKAYHPQMISGKAMQERFPYSAAEAWDERLSQLTEMGLLSPSDHAEYQLTEEGLQAISEILAAFQESLENIPLADIKADHTVGLLTRVVRSAQNNANVTSKQSLIRSRNLAPADDAPTLVRIDQCIDDLNAFRDDSHINSFSDLEIEGHAWELLTALWREELQTAEEAIEKFAFRGHTIESYREALKSLVNRGWANAATQGAYKISESGTLVREAAEVKTDRTFYYPWAALTKSEAAELHDGLAQLDAHLKKMTEAVPA